MQSWDVREIEAPEGTRLAAVLETVDGARAITIRLAPGEELGDHQVRERTWLMVVEGKARIVAGDDVVEAGPGTLLTLEPGERHSVASVGGARIVMILSSWPAEGHYPVWPGDDFQTSRRRSRIQTLEAPAGVVARLSSTGTLHNFALLGSLRS